MSMAFGFPKDFSLFFFTSGRKRCLPEWAWGVCHRRRRSWTMVDRTVTLSALSPKTQKSLTKEKAFSWERARTAPSFSSWFLKPRKQGNEKNKLTILISKDPSSAAECRRWCSLVGGCFRNTEKAEGKNLNLERSTQKATTLLPGKPAPQHQH